MIHSSPGIVGTSPYQKITGFLFDIDEQEEAKLTDRERILKNP
jgi:hypothetical protein